MDNYLRKPEEFGELMRILERRATPLSESIRERGRLVLVTRLITGITDMNNLFYIR
jgi:hypothetical protein